MFSFVSRQTIADSGILYGMTDYHSHILPGVDDGVQSIEKALVLLAFYEKSGIRNVWFTPHIMEDYPNETIELRQRFSNLLIDYTSTGSNRLTLYLASEYMMDSLFLSRLENNDLLPIIDSQHLLVETSYYIPPFNFTCLLKQMTNKGYIPVLAHPERYHYLSAIKEYEKLYHTGTRFQLDIASIVGAYGEEVRSKSLTLLQKGYYSLVGTDIHNLESFIKWINIPIKKTILKSLRTLMNE